MFKIRTGFRWTFHGRLKSFRRRNRADLQKKKPEKTELQNRRVLTHQQTKREFFNVGKILWLELEARLGNARRPKRKLFRNFFARAQALFTILRIAVSIPQTGFGNLFT